jgi:hypothetical protein
LLGLFVLAFRSSLDGHVGTFHTAFSQTVDILAEQLAEYFSCNSQNLLQLPLKSLFSSLPTPHWITRTRQPLLSAHHFFFLDQNQQCLKVKPPIMQPTYPILARRLNKALQKRTHPFGHYRCTSLSGVFNDKPFLKTLKYSYQLLEFCSKTFREQQTAFHLEYIPRRAYSSETWHFSWKLPIKPEARSLWYRLRFNKVHNNLSVFVIDSSVSPLCSLCCYAPEDSFHFFHWLSL